jgi:hypothetical protein
MIAQVTNQNWSLDKPLIGVEHLTTGQHMLLKLRTLSARQVVDGRFQNLCKNFLFTNPLLK